MEPTKLQNESKGILKPASPIGRAIDLGLKSGVSGSIAMSAQITTFMWLHTIMRYQYRHGTSATDTIKTLAREGGITRFYRGYMVAMINAPLIRFGSTGANEATLTYLGLFKGGDIPLWFKTICASSCAAIWKVVWTPLDMVQTTLQVGGSGGTTAVGVKIKDQGFRVLWHGSSAIYVGAIVGHFSWFSVYNTLNQRWDNYDDIKKQTLRDGSIGVLCTITSDVASNFLDVLKTQRQTTSHSIGYQEAISEIVNAEGILGFLTRGLRTRLLTNCLQGAFFTIVWNKLQRSLFNHDR